MADERRLEHQDDMAKLIKEIQLQNAMFAQLLAFLNPIADFFKAMQLIVKVVMWIASGIAIVWGTIQAIKEYMRTHSG